MAVDKKKILTLEKKLDWKKLDDVFDFVKYIIDAGAWSHGRAQSTLMLLRTYHNEASLKPFIAKVGKLLDGREVAV